MGRNAYRDENSTDQPDSYWRRRVITLAAGLCLLSLLAWAFSGGSGKPASLGPKSSQASGIVPAVAYGGAPSPSAAADGSWSPGSATSRSPAFGLPSPSPTSSAGSGSSAGRKQATRAAAVGPNGSAAMMSSGNGTQRGGGCSQAAVVLSLFASRNDYYAGQDPEFTIYAVSTAPGACTFDASPGRLHVVVMSSGRIIWDSADCGRGQANRVVRLSRGIPAQEPVSWNRTISLPGCVTLASAARLGTYQVQARSGTGASPVRTFKLVRLLSGPAKGETC